MNLEETIIAAKVTNELRSRIEAYVTARGITMSKFIRRASEFLMDSDPIAKNNWGVRS